MRISRLLTYSVLSLVALGGFFGSVHIETANQDNQIVSISYEGNGVYADVATNTFIEDYPATQPGQSSTFV